MNIRFFIDPQTDAPHIFAHRVSEEEVEEILNGRIFRTQMELPPRWAEYYDRKVQTRALEMNRRHELSYAY